KLGAGVYAGFGAADICGRFELLAGMPGHGGLCAAADAGPVPDGTARCTLIASASFAELTAPDVVVIGGSLFDRDPDEDVVHWLRRVHPATTWTTSVCTGSIYLAAAGILDGREAPPHWAPAGALGNPGGPDTQQPGVE